MNEGLLKVPTTCLLKVTVWFDLIDEVIIIYKVLLVAESLAHYPKGERSWLITDDKVKLDESVNQ